MKNVKGKIAVAIVGLVIFSIWFLSYQFDNEVEPVSNTSESLPENLLLEEAEEVNGSAEPKIIVQDSQETSVDEPVMSDAELIKLKDDVDRLQSELSALSVDLNANLENPEKRKKIEAQYLRLTEEYNKGLIALVKSKQVSSTVSE